MAAAALAGAALPTSTLAADMAVASPDGLRLRRAPSADAETLTVLPDGVVVHPNGAATGGWVPVDTSAGSGWVSAAYLASPASAGATPAAAPTPTATATPAATPAPAPSGPRRGTTTDSVRVRGGPSTDDPVVGSLPAGAALDVLGASADGGWLRVAGAVIGYVSAGYVTVSDEAAAASAFDVDLAVPFRRQLTPIWCDPADVEMWRAYRTGRAEPSSQAFQQGAWDYELAHNAGFTVDQWDCSPFAVASAATNWVPGGACDHAVHDDATAASRMLAWLLAARGEPSVATIWRGDHYILVRGVRATADPARDPNARVLGFWVADPNQGRPSWLGRDRYVPMDRWLGELLTPVTYLTPGSGVPGDVWQGKYVTIQRAPGGTGPTAGGLRNPTSADYA